MIHAFKNAYIMHACMEDIFECCHRNILKIADLCQYG